MTRQTPFTPEQVAAAQLRVILDEKLSRDTPDLVRRIANSGSGESGPPPTGMDGSPPQPRKAGAPGSGADRLADATPEERAESRRAWREEIAGGMGIGATPAGSGAGQAPNEGPIAPGGSGESLHRAEEAVKVLAQTLATLRRSGDRRGAATVFGYLAEALAEADEVAESSATSPPTVDVEGTIVRRKPTWLVETDDVWGTAEEHPSRPSSPE
ncbi:hypothetical protein VSH64_26140 [Amycolatopsis rhabdoformis]|uniref:DUF2786 domain-containing protein n=1 Tax=Amycolatopsis rhabdoformis TaxID=1448059 RepID=A0ABZ1HWL0_9PSEU|nr:hypothetical protein [Amycolatopsis rhabdoformis]WSE26360.1 hypothetical protein VSH64_26140 [Amycolatopsis rhabdoformis]